MPEHTPAPTPHRAVYGYAFYILMFSLFVFYVFWALFPTKELGFVYLPDKYFAILLPMLFLVAISFFVFIFYPAANISLLPKIDDITTAISPDVALQKYGKNTRRLSSLTWDEMRSVLEAPVKPNKDDPQENVSSSSDHEQRMYCNCCESYHRLSTNTTSQVDPQYFIDLANVNKTLFG